MTAVCERMTATQGDQNPDTEDPVIQEADVSVQEIEQTINELSIDCLMDTALDDIISCRAEEDKTAKTPSPDPRTLPPEQVHPDFCSPGMPVSFPDIPVSFPGMSGNFPS